MKESLSDVGVLREPMEAYMTHQSPERPEHWGDEDRSDEGFVSHHLSALGKPVVAYIIQT